MDSEAVERLMDVILQMKINLAHVTETLYQQTHEIRDQLGTVFEHEKKALEECLTGIDDKLKECTEAVESYKRSYTSLLSMREKLVQLGAEPSPMPTALPMDHIEEIVAWRLQELQCHGRI
jgi:ABC-type enterochelin transport system substrate-binding protein